MPEADRRAARGGGAGGRRDRARLRRPARTRCARSRAATARSATPTSPSTACCARRCSPRAPATAGSPRRARTARSGSRRPRVFIVDPIDGTRAFLAGQKAWALSLAVVEAGRPVAAVVHLPALGHTYAAAAGGGARLNGAPIAAPAPGRARRRAGARHRAASSSPSIWPGGPPPVERHFRAVARLPALPGRRGRGRRRRSASATPGSGTSPPAT